jgi:formamidopyrimidine-DNA glycosylase
VTFGPIIEKVSTTGEHGPCNDAEPMPELPEVEYTRQHLVRWMRGARITAVRTEDPLIVRPKRPSTFVETLTGRNIERIERRGKWLKWTLDGGQDRVFVHLGMTGWFERPRSANARLRFDRVSFDVDKRGKPARIVYVDPRRWGRMILATEDTATWKSLGPDPLDEGIDLDALERKLSRRKKRSIKEALMDQSVLAGVGNIQAIEALWKAAIDPRSKAGAISRPDLKAIAAGLKWTIARTLADLAKGDAAAENPFRIYGRQGEPCPRCKRQLERIVLGGRTTTFCPGCQERRPRARRARASA